MRGFTLVEPLVAMLVLCCGVAGLAGLLVHEPSSAERLELKERAAQESADLLDRLRLYVTADATDQTRDRAPGGCWELWRPESGDLCPDGWALSAGEHDATALLPSALSGPPAGMRLTYSVAYEEGRAQVTARATWKAP